MLKNGFSALADVLKVKIELSKESEKSELLLSKALVDVEIDKWSSLLAATLEELIEKHVSSKMIDSATKREKLTDVTKDDKK